MAARRTSSCVAPVAGGRESLGRLAATIPPQLYDLDEPQKAPTGERLEAFWTTPTERIIAAIPPLWVPLDREITGILERC